MKLRACLIVAGMLLLPAAFVHAATTVENIRVWAENGRTRVVLNLDAPVEVMVAGAAGAAD